MHLLSKQTTFMCNPDCKPAYSSDKHHVNAFMPMSLKNIMDSVRLIVPMMAGTPRLTFPIIVLCVYIHVSHFIYMPLCVCVSLYLHTIVCCVSLYLQQVSHLICSDKVYRDGLDISLSFVFILIFNLLLSVTCTLLHIKIKLKQYSFVQVYDVHSYHKAKYKTGL